ncbi:MAG: glycosyltransferase family protein [Elusimicrobia bacterium]|nr:glycosyltransferase family protein [Elusimicrobiota bacterium]
MSGVGIILQARMGSSRLPGKVVKPLCGRPMLAWIVTRLRRSAAGKRLVVATSLLETEAPLLAVCESLGVEVFRGHETDVHDRYYRCALERGFDAVVRATADNPFVDAAECDRLIRMREERSLDYACAFPEFGSGFPDGVGVEIFTFAALERSWRESTAPRHREHVNEYIQEHPELFRQDVLKAPPRKRAPGLSLTVDTPAQFADAERLYAEYQRREPGGLPSVEWAIQAARKAA